jgi:hypothetical protein
MRAFRGSSGFALYCMVAMISSTVGTQVAIAGPPAGGPDVLGVRLGMPLREAFTTLQTANQNKKLETDAQHFPSIDKPVLDMFGLGFAPANSVENIQVYVTPPPEHQLVYRVKHYLGMQQMFRANVVSSLRAKYGQETYQTNYGGTQMWWLYDEQGNPGRLPSTSNSTEAELENCAATAPGTANAGWFGVGSIQNNLHGIESAPPWCVSTGIIVHATFDPANIVTTLRVDMFDVPLAVRAAQSEMTWLSNLSKAQEQRRLEESKQNKPKL